jgi:AcrR family transcriptional regulator
VSPRRSVTDTRRTRSAIVARAVTVASVEGLEGLTIGRLAADLGMSKSGLLGHFGTKEALQLAVVDAAAEIFAREVSGPTDGIPHGMARLRAMCDSWVSYFERRVFPGGCFFIMAASEFDDRDGPVRDAVAGLVSVWENDLRRQIRVALAAGDLPARTDPDQLVFELNGIAMSLNLALQLRRDATAPARARRAIAERLKLASVIEASPKS